MGKITVSDHVANKQKEYSLYVLYRRAIPSLVDGFKTGQRKAIFTALKTCKNKSIKTLALTGYSFPISQYHHGDVSMTDAIVGMAGKWNNNVPIFTGEGSFGSRMVQKAASPRYTGVKVSKEFDNYFPDLDIVPANPDPDYPEPTFYYPTIPWVLVNGVKGIAVGFATHIAPRSPVDLAKACADYLSGKKVDTVAPTYPSFKGEVNQVGPLSWELRGLFTRKTKTRINITEVPVGYDRAGYVAILEKLKDAKAIVNFADKCSKNGFEFDVTLPNASQKLTDEQLMKKLKLIKKITENLTMIDEDGKLIFFNTIGEVIKHFCEFRLGVYDIRYAAWIKRDEAKVKELDARQYFIRLVNDGKIPFKNFTRAQLVSHLRKLGFVKDHIGLLVTANEVLIGFLRFKQRGRMGD